MSDNLLDGIVDPEMGEISAETEHALEEIAKLPVILGDDIKDSPAPSYAQDVIDDYNYTRKLLILSIEEAQRSLKEARKLFALTSDPKQGEVIVKLLKIISENSDKLFRMHSEIASAQKPKDDDLGKEKQVIVATTAEVLAALKSDKL